MLLFRESLGGFSFTNLRDIASLKAIDINKQLIIKAADDYFNTTNGKMFLFGKWFLNRKIKNNEEEKITLLKVTIT